jgi:anti-sigma factor RsiW
MREHPDETRWNEYAGGELLPGETLEVERHLAACPACRREVERLRELLDGLAHLPREAEPARDLWPEIAARIATDLPLPRKSGRGRIFLQAAAALALFAGGVLVGRTSVDRPEISAGLPGRQDPLHAAAEVQRQGSEYIAALASLTAEHGRPGDPALDQGREAALSTLYGAAYELDKLPSEDLSQVLNAVSVTRKRGARTVPF